MKSVLYYPGFEVTSETWLKFALLYLERLRPIVPYSGDRFLTERFRRVIDSTDLIDPCRPDRSVAQRATLDAIETCERIIRHPSEYEDALGSGDILAHWRNKRSHDYTIFRDKYTNSWEAFLRENNFGTEGDWGMRTCRSLGFVYMTLLADGIARERALHVMTDQSEFDSLSIISSRAPLKAPDCHQVGRALVKLAIPADLDSISVERVLEFRERPGFKQRLLAFHQRVDEYIDSIENGTAKSDFFGAQGTLVRDFSDEVVSIGAGVVTGSLSIWTLMSASSSGLTEYARELAAAGALSASSIIALRTAWTNTRARRFARRYLADLRKLGTAS